MYNITPIIQAVARLICAVMICVLVPYIRTKTTVSQQYEIDNWIKIAVQAAEQIYQGTGYGKAKKAYVLEWLKEHGVTVDDAKLDAMIESAVYELNAGLITVPDPICGVLDTTDGDKNAEGA